ncbi:hypothetical protein [Acidisphaera rubrifaciens]|uniref:Transporter n=1 Tax=Acidisphaera rubrifaciens HS-AP3 TaxID=1231350 RepID=A0A0D6P5V9_9PROT|nr:hypothetical protein [Acidisphaera rubrifaciens]GAN76716.1 hypothetical protein Asru_0150_03 [Acidisphaera rubrifaciens HS-AP3]
MAPRRLGPIVLAALLGSLGAAHADDTISVNDAGILDMLETYAAEARATQPAWSSPLVTTSALLEDRARFDVAFQQAGNGSSTTVYDGGKGVDVIISPTQEIQIANAPFLVRSGPDGRGTVDGFADVPLLRFKQRLASGPDYILAAWLQAVFPTGGRFGTGVVTLLPTIGFGRSYGPAIVQGTVGASIPTGHESTLGTQVLGNLAFQLRVAGMFWPQLEVSSTYSADGRRGGLTQTFLTPGIIVGRFALAPHFQPTVGIGYQTAVTPNYRAVPLTPLYNHAWIVTTRVSF